jgi:hypothetical protein
LFFDIGWLRREMGKKGIKSEFTGEERGSVEERWAWGVVGIGMELCGYLQRKEERMVVVDRKWG